MRKVTNNKPRSGGSQNRELPDPKTARESAGISGERLAAKVGCSASMVWLCERRRSFPVQRALRAAYLKALGLSEVARA